MREYSKPVIDEDKLYARVSSRGRLTFFLETPFDDLFRLTDKAMIAGTGYVPSARDCELHHVVDGFYKVKIKTIRRPMQDEQL